MNAAARAETAYANADTQFVLIDLLKAVAAQLIVLHHLAFYGPMADHVRPAAPSLIGWLDVHARIAVQIFLVISGFLAARSLFPHVLRDESNIRRLLWRRYLKLAPPFLVATLLTVGASLVASQWMNHYSISPMPDLAQLAAHALLLHSVLGVESISAGAWYVAIDFQLYAAAAVLAWLAGKLRGAPAMRWLLPTLVLSGICASLLHFNRNSDWDIWALYFFGSYGLGMLAWWGSDPARNRSARIALALMIVIPALAALAVDFRSRIALASAVACALFLLGRARLPFPEGLSSVVHRLGKESYSLFLIHFPVSLIVNAAFTRFLPEQVLWQAAGMLLAWATCLVAASMFYRWIELPTSRLLSRDGLSLHDRHRTAS